jgi:ABC-type multidrug transport system ATPase subunit
VGFMQSGRLIVEGPPSRLRGMLADRILEVVGRPLAQLRRCLRTDPDVEDAQMFGDRVHLRTHPGTRDAVAERARRIAAEKGIAIDRIRPVAAGLEDVFISLLEAQP